MNSFEPIVLQLAISFVPALMLLFAFKLTLIEQPFTLRTHKMSGVGERIGESWRIKLIVTSGFLFFQSLIVKIFAENAFVFVFVLAIVIVNLASIWCTLTKYQDADQLVKEIRKSRSTSSNDVLKKELESFFENSGKLHDGLLKPFEFDLKPQQNNLSFVKLCGIGILTLFPVMCYFWIFFQFDQVGLEFIRTSGFEPFSIFSIDTLLAFALANYGLGATCLEGTCSDELKQFVSVIGSPVYRAVLFFYFFSLFYPIIRFISSLREYRSLLIERNTEDLGLETDVVQKIGLILSIVLSIFFSLLLIKVHVGEIGIFSGLVAAAISLALRDTLGNLMAGALLIWDGSLQKGDVVTIPRTDTNDTGSTYGIIREMRMRYTVIEDRNTVRRLIPNSVLVTEPIESWTHENNQVRLSMNIGVGYGTDLQVAKQIMESVCYDVNRIMTSKPPQALVVNFGDHSIDFSLRFWLRDTNAGIRPVISEVLIGIKDRFDDAGIEIPFPQLDVGLKNHFDIKFNETETAKNGSIKREKIGNLIGRLPRGAA